jgi:Na+/H+ antiporter NhaB
MNVLFDAFLHGLLVGAIIASVTVVLYLLYIKLKGSDETQDAES